MFKNKFVKYIFILIFVAGLLFIAFNDSGFFKFLRLKGEVKELKNDVNNKEQENENLEAEIDSLEKRNPAKMEKTAREKYGMMKKGEKVIKVEEK